MVNKQYNYPKDPVCEKDATGAVRWQPYTSDWIPDNFVVQWEMDPPPKDSEWRPGCGWIPSLWIGNEEDLRNSLSGGPYAAPFTCMSVRDDPKAEADWTISSHFLPKSWIRDRSFLADAGAWSPFDNYVPVDWTLKSPMSEGPSLQDWFPGCGWVHPKWLSKPGFIKSEYYVQPNERNQLYRSKPTAFARTERSRKKPVLYEWRSDTGFESKSDFRVDTEAYRLLDDDWYPGCGWLPKEWPLMSVRAVAVYDEQLLPQTARIASWATAQGQKTDVRLRPFGKGGHDTLSWSWQMPAKTPVARKIVDPLRGVPRLPQENEPESTKLVDRPIDDFLTQVRDVPLLDVIKCYDDALTRYEFKFGLRRSKNTAGWPTWFNLAKCYENCDPEYPNRCRTVCYKKYPYNRHIGTLREAIYGTEVVEREQEVFLRGRKSCLDSCDAWEGKMLKWYDNLTEYREAHGLARRRRHTQCVDQFERDKGDVFNAKPETITDNARSRTAEGTASPYISEVIPVAPMHGRGGVASSLSSNLTSNLTYLIGAMTLNNSMAQGTDQLVGQARL